MIRLAISVEGRTEEEFVKGVLAEYLRTRGVEPVPILLGRARGGSGGGNISIERLASEMAELYRNFDTVTSLVDFYGFRGKGDRTVEELEGELNRAIRTRISNNWDHRKVTPYVQKYEFEGLLFSNVDAFSSLTGATDALVEELGKIRAKFPTPEDINDSSDTAPSKRIDKLMPSYQKVVDCSLIVAETGLDTIRSVCPRFNAWVARLESLNSPPQAI